MLDQRKIRLYQLLIICIPIAVLFVIGFLWMIFSTTHVVYRAPSRPALPHPNAYDTYVSAAKSMVSEEQIYEALYSKPWISSSPTAATTLPPGVPVEGKLTHPYNLSEKQAVIKSNTKAFSIFRQGLKQDFLLPESTSSSFPKFGKLRSLARLVALEAMVYRESGKNGKSMMTCLDGMELGTHTARGGNLMANSTSIAIQAIVRKNVWETVDSLDLVETRKAISRLESIISQTVPFKSAILSERDYALSLTEEILNANDWRSGVAFLHVPDAMSIRNTVKYYQEYSKTFCKSRRGLFAGVYNDYSKLIESTDLPYADCIKTNIQPSNEFSEFLLPYEIKKLRFKYEDNRCMNDLLLLQLALHAYKLENNRYPAKLGDLAPGYLKSIPLDPFNAGATYKYKLTPKRYTLYSLGPDLKDNNGKAVIRPQGPKLRWVVFEDKGDIVAGYNK